MIEIYNKRPLGLITLYYKTKAFNNFSHLRVFARLLFLYKLFPITYSDPRCNRNMIKKWPKFLHQSISLKLKDNYQV